MKTLTISIVMLLVSVTALATDLGESYCGLWLTANKKMVVKIYQEKGMLQGRVHEMKEEMEDFQQGDIILTGLLQDKDGSYTEGQFIKGTRKIDCSMILGFSGVLLVTFKKGLISRKVAWTKIEE